MTINKYAFKECSHFVEDISVPMELDWRTIKLPSLVQTLTGMQVKFNGKKINQYDPWEGWYTEKAPHTVFPNEYVIRFHNPFRLRYQAFTVSYAMVQADCLRCKSLGHYLEMQLEHVGQFKRATGVTKLIQEVTVFVMNQIGTMYMFEWLGTHLVQLSGTKFDPRITPTLVRNDILAALEKYSSLQTQQSKYQTLDPKEAYRSILNVRRATELEDEVTIAYEIVIKNAADDVLNIPVRMRFS